MISKKTFQFLTELKNNNNKEWFTANKPQYEESKKEMEIFIVALYSEIQKFDKSISGIDPTKTIFRIYRDVRFSKDKSPYKTNFGAHISATDKQSFHNVAGYYIQIEPGKCMLGGGAYMPSTPWLDFIRKNILANGKEFHKILKNKEFTSFFKFEGEKLKRPPKGIDSNHPDIEILKQKSFLAMHQMSDNQVLASDFLTHCASAFKGLYPFHKFLNQKG